MGAFINDTTPESVAERLRAVVVPESSPVHAATASAALGALPEGVHT
ncbi:galactose-1-Phosphate uridylyltransferase [Arthrobacter sp. Hiyo4]|nr:galactose-1-Phosphate uridylyltransferase [Arthrobacter sp. Hiyo4]